MKVLGISGSPRPGESTERLVREVLSTVEAETEFISLAGMNIGPCVACLGCVKDNVCVVNDDFAQLRDKLVEADAYVIGAPNYFATLNALTHCFLERFYQFRHREGRGVAGKLGIAVSVGGGEPGRPLEQLKTFFQYNGIECVGEVCAQGTACCFICGYGESCRVGSIHRFFGPGTRISEEITPTLDKQPEKLAEARELGRLLSRRLGERSAGA